ADAHRGRAHDPDPAAARRQELLRARGLCPDLRAHPGGGPMTTIDPASTLVAETPHVSRKNTVIAGRVILALLLLLGWQAGAQTFGSIFFAYPLDVLWRLIEIARNGQMFTDLAA